MFNCEKKLQAIVIIPARYTSTRFPGKPLALLSGKPMIQWTYEAARKAKTIEEVIVATDDERIACVVRDFGGKVVMTSTTHLSGTDRLAEAVKNLECEIVVNVQGDEPLIRGEHIDQLVKGLENDFRADMATLVTKVKNREELISPHVVKVVTTQEGFALYFSRSPIPFSRKEWKDLNSIKEERFSGIFFKHIGIYSYRKPFLLTFSSLKPTPLEVREELEQLRALEHGFRIKVIFSEYDSQHVDTKEDLIRVEQLLNTRTPL